MAPRKYRAKSIQAAVKQIKEELGPDAMILSTRRISKNVRDPYGKEIFEVTAIPQSEVADMATGRQKPINMLQSKNLFQAVDDDLDDYLNIPDPPSTENRVGISDHPVSNKIPAAESLQTELTGIKNMLYLINEAKGIPVFFQNHPECLTLYTKLVKAGISEKRVQRFMLNAKNLAGDILPSPQEITKRVLENILSVIEVDNPFGSDSDEMNSHGVQSAKRHLAAFIGPTGVGKTTTIAKLAADLSLKQKRQIGLISIDSYRIGALEQLKTYSAIMGLPCLPAFTQQDLEIAVKKMRNKEIILIDTAGHGHLDEKRMKELARLMGGNLAISSHLVLSVTTRPEDMKEAAEHFNLLRPRTYVFTKIDETRRRGVIVDQVLDLKMPISFVTNGQRVPEDFIAASKKNILELILKQET